MRLFTDLGGLYQCLFVIVTFLIDPINKHFAQIDVIQSLYQLKTKDNDLFKSYVDYTGKKKRIKD